MGEMQFKIAHPTQPDLGLCCLQETLFMPKVIKVNPFPNKPWFLRVCTNKSFGNTVGKGEIPRNEQFLLFP